MQSLLKPIIVCLVLCSLSGCTSIQGKYLTLNSPQGWTEIGQAQWTWKALGEVVADAGDGFLVSEDRYSDYELHLEFNVDASTNSGVMIHCQNPADITPMTCYEINIWDHHPQQENRTGAIVTRVPPFVRIDTLGRWNVFRVKVNRAAIEVYLNDQLVSRLTEPQFTSGHIALQRAIDGTARFRSFEILSTRR